MEQTLIEDEGRRAASRAALVEWFDQVKRSLPWRQNQDPWRIWVSEIMLQQTRVSSVIGYFERFIVEFPTPAALAVADPERLRSLWAGLGYYARARNLQRAAQQVVERHGGTVPSDRESFGALSGVGPYTRGAVLSIAFGQEEPLVDGNVERVFARLFAIDGDLRERSRREQLWSIATRWVKGPRPGDFNQALMELGATCCTPKRPSCLLCPLHDRCAARRLNRVGELPQPRVRKKIPVEHRIAVLCEADEGDIWLTQRRPKGLLASLWELPSISIGEGELGNAEAQNHALVPLGIATTGAALAKVTHRFTHREWQLTLFAGRRLAEGELIEAPSLDYTRWDRVARKELDDRALSGPGLKLLLAAGLPLKRRRGAGKKIKS